MIREAREWCIHTRGIIASVASEDPRAPSPVIATRTADGQTRLISLRVPPELSVVEVVDTINHYLHLQTNGVVAMVYLLNIRTTKPVAEPGYILVSQTIWDHPVISVTTKSIAEDFVTDLREIQDAEIPFRFRPMT